MSNPCKMISEICSASSKRLLSFVQCSMTSDELSSSIALLMFRASWRISSVNSRRLVSSSVILSISSWSGEEGTNTGTTSCCCLDWPVPGCCPVCAGLCGCPLFEFGLICMLARALAISAWFRVSMLCMAAWICCLCCSSICWIWFTRFCGLWWPASLSSSSWSLMVTSLRQLAQCAGWGIVLNKR